jgi:hypothetical protein
MKHQKPLHPPNIQTKREDELWWHGFITGSSLVAAAAIFIAVVVL